MQYVNLQTNEFPEVINVLIEIPANSLPIKYELDKDTNLLKVDRFIAVSMFYPCNYGFIEGTLGRDGDPLDALIITRYPLMPKCSIKVRPIGMLVMQDEAGPDEKILCVPTSKLDPFYDEILEFSDLPSIQLKQIEHFFWHYKDLEPEKSVQIKDWQNAKNAKNCILSCVK